MLHTHLYSLIFLDVPICYAYHQTSHEYFLYFTDRLKKKRQNEVRNQSGGGKKSQVNEQEHWNHMINNNTVKQMLLERLKQ